MPMSAPGSRRESTSQVCHASTLCAGASLSLIVRRFEPMARERTVYRCSECGADAPKWLGWCPACDASGTLIEEVAAAGATGGAALARVAEAPVPPPLAEGGG